MKKRIILCSDGTGNSGGKGRGTNVWRLFCALDLNPNPKRGDVVQIALHDDGVGTDDNRFWKLLGGIAGLGLKRNLIELYSFLARNYQGKVPNSNTEADEIYIFGFSRGAYTARVLAGLIGLCGVPQLSRLHGETLEEVCNKAITLLRRSFKRFGGTHQATNGAVAKFRSRYSWNQGEASIKFLGVWDTVDAYGFPIEEIADFWDWAIYPFKFPDQKLGKHVIKAAHALSIDDERLSFQPTLWDVKGEEDPSRIQQVWFAGVHSNVGGGYPKDGLALIALKWMMAQTDLRWIPSKHAEIYSSANLYDKLYDSRAGLGSLYRISPRPIDALCRAAGCEVYWHESVFHRIAAGVEGYAPGNAAGKVTIVNDMGSSVGANAPNQEPALRRSLNSSLSRKTLYWSGALWFFVVVGLAILRIRAEPDNAMMTVVLSTVAIFLGRLILNTWSLSIQARSKQNNQASWKKTMHKWAGCTNGDATASVKNQSVGRS